MPKKIKVVLFTTEFQFGGVQFKLLKLARGLDKAQFDVHVFSNGRGQLASEFDKIPGVQSQIIPCLIRKPSPMRDLIASVALCWAIGKVKPDIIDYTGVKAALLGAPISWLMRVPIRIFTMGGVLFNDAQSAFVRAVFRGLDRFVCRFSTHVISVCHVNRKKILANRVTPEEKSRVVYSPSDLSAFIQARAKSRSELRRSYGWGERDFVALQVSNLIRSKNNIALLEAARRLGRSNPDLRFVIVGDGAEMGRMKRFIKKHALSNCSLLGWRRDVPDLMRAADVVTLTTKYQEGLPQVCAQAMAAAKPMVMYDWEGISEELEDGINGYLIKPDDLDAFCRRIRELAADPQRAEAMGLEGAKRLNPQHETAFMVGRMEEIYREAAQGAGVAVPVPVPSVAIER